jgi:hypothetical protein
MASSRSKSRADKLRIRAMGEGGKPAAHVHVELVAPPAGSGNTATERIGVITLRALTTSRDGFAIFSLANISPALRSGGRLSVRFAGRPELTFAVADGALTGGNHYIGYQLTTGGWDPEPNPGPWVDDGLDADDIWIAPGHFPDLGDLEFGDDYCGRLIPNDLTVRIFYRDQVVRTKKNVVTCLTGQDGASIVLHEGEMIHYEVKATRLGYTFGDLLYSLPLAPCESVTLAISHWEQRQQARAEQDTVSVEKRSSTYDRQNALSEVLNASSSGTHVSGGLTGALTGFVGAALGSIGLSVSASYNRNDFASDATRNFSDSIQQTAELYRSDHQVVVMEQQETEDQAVSYRTVCNNNHCHVLNIFYHEVLNNFRVTTTMLGHREVYFVPFDVVDFDEHSAACAKPFLLPYLLDRNLADCYRKLKYVAVGHKTTATGTGGNVVNQFKVEMNFETAPGHDPQWPFYLIVMLKVGGLQFFPIARNDVWIGLTPYAYLVDTPDFDPDNIQSVGVRNGAPNVGFAAYLRIGALTISMRDRASAQWLVVGTRNGVNLAPTGGNPAMGDVALINNTQSAPPQPSQPPSAPAATPAQDYQDCLDQVLAHLNCNATYYSMLLALLEDPNARICRFDKIVCGGSGQSLADLIGPDPVGVMGCTLAFPKADSVYTPYTGDPIFDERLLTLPTPGIFADAALGQCQACEAIDDKVYWDWSKTPCVCGGKDVTLKTPEASPLIQPGTSPFPTISYSTWTGLVPPTGETITNGLVTTFGAALATAMFSGADASKNLESIKDTLAQLVDFVKGLQPPKKDDGKGDPPKPGG